MRITEIYKDLQIFPAEEVTKFYVAVAPGQKRGRHERSDHCWTSETQNVGEILLCHGVLTLCGFIFK